MKLVKGLSKMTIFQHKYYFVKSVHERGRGVKNMSTWFTNGHKYYITTLEITHWNRIVTDIGPSRQSY